MAFQQNSNGFNNGNFSSNNGEKKKTNFKVGKIYGTDGTLDVSVWNSDKGGCYGIISARAAIGKDPSTGANAYEQKMSGELPSIFMNVELMRALVDGLKAQDPGTLNVSLDTKRGASMNIIGAGNSVKITIDNKKTGTRTITLDAVPVGNKNIHANFLNLIDMLDICFKKAIRNKLDPEEFSMAVGGDTNGETNPDEAPFI